MYLKSNKIFLNGKIISRRNQTLIRFFPIIRKTWLILTPHIHKQEWSILYHNAETETSNIWKITKLGTATINEEKTAGFGWRWRPLPWAMLILKGGKYIHFDKCLYFYSISQKSLMSYRIKVKVFTIHQKTLFCLHFKKWNKQECYKNNSSQNHSFHEGHLPWFRQVFPTDSHVKYLISRLGCYWKTVNL